MVAAGQLRTSGPESAALLCVRCYLGLSSHPIELHLETWSAPRVAVIHVIRNHWQQTQCELWLQLCGYTDDDRGSLACNECMYHAGILLVSSQRTGKCTHALQRFMKRLLPTPGLCRSTPTAHQPRASTPRQPKPHAIPLNAEVSDLNLTHQMQNPSGAQWHVHRCELLVWCPQIGAAGCCLHTGTRQIAVCIAVHAVTRSPVTVPRSV